MRRYLSKEIGFALLFFLFGLIVVFYDIYRKNQLAATLRLEEVTEEILEAERDQSERALSLDFAKSTLSSSADNMQSAWLQIKTRQNEKILSALMRHSVPSDHAAQIVRQIHYFARTEKSAICHAKENVFIFQTFEESGPVCGRVVFFTPSMKKVILRLKDKKFVLESPPEDLAKTVELYEGVVQKNFYYDAQKCSIDPTLIEKSMMIFRHALDFQREIRKGDSFQILAEKSYDKETGFIGNTRLLYSEISMKHKKLSAYCVHSFRSKVEMYLDESSYPLHRELLVTPIRGAHISSSFGRRRHPIRGYTRFHPGVDFAARTGTPILAAGHGIVKKLTRSKKGYGNTVLLSHDKGYSTLYAHMHSFVKGLKQGARVEQGSVIGYVGSTGLSTGPHLHYEVRIKGKRVNPQKVNKLPPEALKGKDYEEFLSQKAVIDRKLHLLRA
ncbi:MAG: M23 family metallopeptidase [Alphaproteobacteria bacterium]|nr:M23 family metallopeptidase [Alphaproteobacteria bacterium]